MKGRNYTKIHAYTGKGKHWYVRFKFLHEGVWETVYDTADANREKDLKVRKRIILDLKAWYEDRLSRGYNPVTKKFEQTFNPADPVAHIRAMQGDQALYWILEQDKYNAPIKSKYKSCIKYFWEAAIALKFGSLNISEIKRGHIKLIMQKVALDRELRPRTVNDYLTSLKTLFKRLIGAEVLEYNPVDNIQKPRKQESQAHQPPNDAEMIIIKSALRESPVGFQMICETVYSGAVREVELCRLRKEDIDFSAAYIILKSGTIRKSKARIVVIPRSLIEKYREHLKDAVGSDFVFTSNNFQPGQKLMNRNVISSYWKMLIKEGRSIEKSLYSLKTRGNDDRRIVARDKGITLSDDALMVQNGHESIDITNRHYSTMQKRLEAVEEVLRLTAPELL